MIFIQDFLMEDFFKKKKTGAAGCGKTYVINCFKKYCIEVLEKPNFVKVAAPTGTLKNSLNINDSHMSS